ncbi:MAG: hypothetical protein ACRCT6_12730 [Notoacmeibacter sp.]
MTQSKQEVADRNARIRAQKLRENLVRRKQQIRQRLQETEDRTDALDGQTGKNTGEKSLG